MFGLGGVAHAQAPVGISTFDQSVFECVLRQKSVEPCERSIVEGSVEHVVDETLSSGSDQVFKDGALVRVPLGKSPFLLELGDHLGGSILQDEEVLEDEARRRTDQLLGRGVWVRHELQLRPRLQISQHDNRIGPLHARNRFFGFIPEKVVTVRLVKRHGMQDYPRNFWGYFKRDLKTLQQTLPTYLKLPGRLTGWSLLDGESIQVESYAQFSVVVGPNLKIGSAQLIGPSALAGAVTFGAHLSVMRGLFRYTVERIDLSHARAILERGRGDKESFFFTAGPNFLFGKLLDLIQPALNWEWGRTHVYDRLIDATFDLGIPEAQDALAHAWHGNFEPTLNAMADEEAGRPQGVHGMATATMDQTTHFSLLQVLGFERSTSYTHLDSNTTVLNEEFGDADEGGFTHRTERVERADTGTSKRKGWRATRTISASVRTGGATGGRNLVLKFDFAGTHSKSDELLEVTRVSAALAPEASRAEALSQLRRVEADAEGERRDLRAHFHGVVTSGTLEALLAPDGDSAAFRARFQAAWSSFFGPARSLSEPDLAEPWKRAEQFLKVVDRARLGKTPGERAEILARKLRGGGMDLYVFGTLALLDSTSASVPMAFRATITRKKEKDSEDDLRWSNL